MPHPLGHRDLRTASEAIIKKQTGDIKRRCYPNPRRNSVNVKQIRIEDMAQIAQFGVRKVLKFVFPLLT